MLEKLLGAGLLFAVAVMPGTAACGGNPLADPAPGSHGGNTTPFVVKVEGLVYNLAGTCPTVTFLVSHTTVATTSKTAFKNGWCSILHNNLKVQVEGPMQPDGSITAVEVKFDPR